MCEFSALLLWDCVRRKLVLLSGRRDRLRQRSSVSITRTALTAFISRCLGITGTYAREPSPLRQTGTCPDDACRPDEMPVAFGYTPRLMDLPLHAALIDLTVHFCDPTGSLTDAIRFGIVLVAIPFEPTPMQIERNCSRPLRKAFITRSETAERPLRSRARGLEALDAAEGNVKGESAQGIDGKSELFEQHANELEGSVSPSRRTVFQGIGPCSWLIKQKSCEMALFGVVPEPTRVLDLFSAVFDRWRSPRRR